ncbi:MAG: efflux RND transporter periplasmic adaptor subunit [Desulfobacterales bacterium]|jgi:Cu(I)/Ag(I) efflux system membrane fusion protein|nr:efflux RND transporter periplasmic adaptor subunit [Desulfobacterales bacterium]
MNRRMWAILLLAALAAAASPSRAQHPSGHGASAPPAAQKADDLDELKGLTMESIRKEGKVQEIAPGNVQISPERQQLIGVRFGSVEKRSLTKVIRTVGRIDYDEKRIGIVSPKISGWIEQLYVDFTGRFVRKGEPLLTIYSPELVSTQEEYLLALKARQDWSKSPFSEVTEGGNLLAESARRRLKLWDISDAQIQALEESREPKKTLTLYSPFTGHVLEKMVNKGQFVDAGMALFKIADLSVVWLIADIYESELSAIRVGQPAAIQMPYYPGETFTGKAIYIYPYMDAQTRTAKVRYEFANPHGKLKPEMFADVEITVPLGDRLAVPEGAVIDTGVRKVVIVDRGSGYFEPREVRLGARASDLFEVLDGLKAGERVVTSANFLIDSESKLKEAVGGMGHQH